MIHVPVAGGRVHRPPSGRNKHTTSCTWLEPLQGGTRPSLHIWSLKHVRGAGAAGQVRAFSVDRWGGARITKGALPALYALPQYRRSCPPSIEAPSISAQCSSFRAPSACIHSVFSCDYMRESGSGVPAVSRTAESERVYVAFVFCGAVD